MRHSLLLLGMLALLTSAARAEKAKLEGVVNLNTASPEELGLIPGVGPARIRNILAYRKAHPFRTVDELARIKGIGRKTVRQWRMHLAVGGPSTAQKVVRPEQPNGVVAGPPLVAAKPLAAKPPLPRPGGRPGLPPRPPLRRGEPAHLALLRAPGMHCLPPR
jgi:competence protein ComEA